MKTNQSKPRNMGFSSGPPKGASTGWVEGKFSGRKSGPEEGSTARSAPNIIRCRKGTRRGKRISEGRKV